MKEKFNKYIAEAYFGMHWLLLAIPLLIYSFFAFKEIGLPGLYMDSVNPDYQAAWLIRGDKHIPAWIYPDNYFAGDSRLPLLNSLYGGNITAYLASLFFAVTGFGLGEVRVFHALLGILVLISLSWCLHKWKLSPIASTAMLCLLALDPTFIFSWRAAYYLQLTPLIFMSIGLGMLGEHYQRYRSGVEDRHLLMVSGAFLGFAAYCYFIFAFYSAVIVFIYIWCYRQHSQFRRVAVPLIAGAILGWLPYLYAHLSIILNRNFDSYLEMLRGLQTNYGVIDQNQGGFIDRLHTVWQRLGYLVAGHSIQVNIFRDWKGTSFFRISHLLILLLGPALTLFSLLLQRAPSASAEISSQREKVKILIAMMAALLVAHFIFGLIIGRPLNLQHYVMLIPIIYVMTAGALTYLSLILVAPWRLRGILRGAVFALFLSMMAINFSLSWGVVERLKQTGGEKMFSDAINVAASHIQTLNTNTVLLFPQWGYWMGVLTVTGPRFSAYEAASLNEMQTKLRYDTELINQHSFAMIVGLDLLKDSSEEARRKIEDFARESGLKIESITYCSGRNGHDQLWLVKMTRGKLIDG